MSDNMIIIKKFLRRLFDEFEWARLWFCSWMYYRKPSVGEMNEKPQGDFCDLATVAFNNARVIEYQIMTLRKFFTFPYRHTVFDNSTNDIIANEIKTICLKYGTGYIRLPKQDFIRVGQGSYSHGVACNYLYKRFLQSGGGKYFGLLDHDIFPIESFDVSIFLEKQFFYGVRHRFYIWPGFFFVRMKEAAQKNLDFRPSLWLRGDTGACNAYSLFKGIDFARYELVSEEKRNFTQEGDIFDNGYSYFSCGWVHCWNASNYMGKNIDKKMERIFCLLEEELF